MEISRKQRILGSWWILLSLVLLLNGLGLIFVGIRAKCKRWKIFGLGYIIVGWVLMSFELVGVYFFLWFVSIIHTVYIRNEYFIRMKILYDSKDIIEAKKQEENKKLVNKVYKDIFGDVKDSFVNNVENTTNTVVAKSEIKQTKNIKVNEKEINKLDINYCSDVELSQVPGIGIILSKRAMDIRNEHGEFKSLESFYNLLNISYEKQLRINKYLKCGTNKVVEEAVKKEGRQKIEIINEDKNRNIGRKIDF